MRASRIAAALGLLLAAALAFGQTAHVEQGGELEALARSAAEGDAEAVRGLNQRAEGGDVVAQHIVGLMHLFGHGVRRSEVQALIWFQRAAEKGHVASMHYQALVHERSKVPELHDEALARRFYRAAADRGHARSQTNLGNMLLQGIGGDRDAAAGRQWLEKAASQNEPHGQYLLGMLMLEGPQREKNQDEAARLIDNAALNGDRDAQYRLALLYSSGPGRDERVALHWLLMAAERQHPNAQYSLAVLFSRGTFGLKQDDAAAAGWLAKSASHGNSDAQYALGIAYAEGRGVPQNNAHALAWFQEAEKNGHPKAREQLARMRTRAAGPGSPIGRNVEPPSVDR